MTALVDEKEMVPINGRLVDEEEEMSFDFELGST